MGRYHSELLLSIVKSVSLCAGQLPGLCSIVIGQFVRGLVS